MRRLGLAALLFSTGCACQPKAPEAVQDSAVPPPRAPEASRLEASPPELSLPKAPPPEPSPPEAPPLETAAGASALPSTAASPSSEPPRAVAEAGPTAAEKQQCRARGGTMQPVCMMGQLFCVVRYRDGGKRCTDKRDCIGACLYEGPDPAPSPATGSCQRTNDPCGCKAPIHHGRVRPAVCLD